MPMGRGCNAQACRHDPACRNSNVIRPESRVGASAATASVSLPGSPQPAAGEVPIQVPTKRRSPSVLYRRQQQPRRAMERVRRSRTSAQSDLGEGCSAISGLSGRSECRVRTGAICLVGEAVGKVASHKNAMYISSEECGCNLVQTFDRMIHDSLAEWNANGGSQI